jgi:hypothetical protein
VAHAYNPFTWEVNIGRTKIQGCLQGVHETSSQSIAGHSGVHLSPQATLEAEIGRVMIQSQSGQKKFARPHLNGKMLGMVVHACQPSEAGSIK